MPHFPLIGTFQEGLATARGAMAEPSGSVPPLLVSTAVTELDAELAELLLALRHRARKEKQFDRADRIRSKLSALGALCEDLPNGVRYKL